MDQCRVDNVKIYHADTKFTDNGHYGAPSNTEPYYDSAALIGESAAKVAATNIVVGKWEIYDQTGSTRRLTEQTFTALPYVGELGSNEVSVNGKVLTKGVPEVTTEFSIIGEGETIQTAPAN